MADEADVRGARREREWKRQKERRGERRKRQDGN